MDLSPYITKAELPGHIGVTRQRVSKLYRAGKLPQPDETTVTGEPLWTPETIDEWMSQTGRTKGSEDGDE